jgi:hypothetical protein
MLAPDVHIALLDGMPAGTWERSLSEVVARATVARSWGHGTSALALGRDGAGLWAIVEAQARPAV